MEDLFKELSEFARKNRKALKPAEQWLNEFDGNIEDAWKKAKKESPRDGTKIVFIAWLASDEKIYECEFIDKDFDVCQWCPTNKDGPNPQRDFLHDVILRVGYSTDEGEDNLLIIQTDLTAMGKAPAGISDTPKIVLSNLEQSVLEELAGRPGEALTIRMISNHLNMPESTIRDTVNRLVKMGLVGKREGRRGFFATDKSIKWYNDRWNK